MSVRLSGVEQAWTKQPWVRLSWVRLSSVELVTLGSVELVRLSYDPTHIVESLQERVYEDFECAAEDELYEFFREWNAKQDLKVYRCENVTAVVLDWTEDSET